MMNPITIHSPLQHVVNMIGIQHPISSQVMIPPSGVLIQQPMITIPHSAIMVPHHPQSMTWAPQPQNIPTTPVQPYVGQVHQTLVDIKSPPLGGKYALWGQAPIT